jgi:hypothetical protein
MLPCLSQCISSRLTDHYWQNANIAPSIEDNSNLCCLNQKENWILCTWRPSECLKFFSYIGKFLKVGVPNAWNKVCVLCIIYVFYHKIWWYKMFLKSNFGVKYPLYPNFGPQLCTVYLTLDLRKTWFSRFIQNLWDLSQNETIQTVFKIRFCIKVPSEPYLWATILENMSEVAPQKALRWKLNFTLSILWNISVTNAFLEKLD